MHEDKSKWASVCREQAGAKTILQGSLLGMVSVWVEKREERLKKTEPAEKHSGQKCLRTSTKQDGIEAL